MATGTLNWFDAEKGYGFITPDDGSRELFVQRSGIAADDYKSLAQNTRVQYEPAQGRKAHATGVTRAPR